MAAFPQWKINCGLVGLDRPRWPCSRFFTSFCKRLLLPPPRKGGWADDERPRRPRRCVGRDFRCLPLLCAGTERGARPWIRCGDRRREFNHTHNEELCSILSVDACPEGSIERELNDTASAPLEELHPVHAIAQSARVARRLKRCCHLTHPLRQLSIPVPPPPSPPPPSPPPPSPPLPPPHPSRSVSRPQPLPPAAPPPRTPRQLTNDPPQQNHSSGESPPTPPPPRAPPNSAAPPPPTAAAGVSSAGTDATHRGHLPVRSILTAVASGAVTVVVVDLSVECWPSRPPLSARPERASRARRWRARQRGTLPARGWPAFRN